VAALAIGFSSAVASAQTDPKPKLPPIYDSSVSADAQIAEALAEAKRDNQRVLLQFGANWCVWCHRLHDVFKNDKEIARTLQYEYEIVLVDVDEVDGQRRHAAVIERYGHPIKHGLPVIVVLDAEGKQLATQETASWEAGEAYENGRIAAFLDKWKAKPISAKDALSNAQQAARSAGKSLFVYFSAPWCGYCHRLTALFYAETTGSIFQAAFVPVKIDIERMPGGPELAELYGRTDEDGLPFWVVLDATGKKLADSRSEKGNVGFPVEPHEIEHFLNALKQYGAKLTPPQLATVEKALKGDKDEE
jgi:thiol:disulfide interchange protein